MLLKPATSPNTAGLHEPLQRLPVAVDGRPGDEPHGLPGRGQELLQVQPVAVGQGSHGGAAEHEQAGPGKGQLGHQGAGGAGGGEGGGQGGVEEGGEVELAVGALVVTGALVMVGARLCGS